MRPMLTQVMRPELRLTGLQILTMRLLACPGAKLEEEIEEALEDNPLLVRLDTSAIRPSESVGQPEPTPLDGFPGRESTSDWATAPANSPFDWPEERTPVSTEHRETFSLENFSGDAPSLADHLHRQLGAATSDEEVLAAGEAIIGNLDDNGYLRATLSELATATKTSLLVVERTLTLVQTFDPVGVAARDPRECLLLQLRADSAPDPVAIDAVNHHLALIAQGRYDRLARALGQPIHRIQEAIRKIKALDPKPGRAFGMGDARAVKPDLTVEKIAGEYVVTLNDRGLPVLHVARRPLRSWGPLGGLDRRFLSERRRAAHWLIEAIEQRRRTLQRVGEALVRFQRAFLDHGPAHLRPLILRQVAEEISVHESTVSRATSGKYIDTPQGIFPLKHFFQQGISSPDGGLVSPTAVKVLLRALVAGEDRTHPLSDTDLAHALGRSQLFVSRRTVAKYRDELAILPSHHRRITS